MWDVKAAPPACGPLFHPGPGGSSWGWEVPKRILPFRSQNSLQPRRLLSKRQVYLGSGRVSCGPVYVSDQVAREELCRRPRLGAAGGSGPHMSCQSGGRSTHPGMSHPYPACQLRAPRIRVPELGAAPCPSQPPTPTATPVEGSAPSPRATLPCSAPHSLPKKHTGRRLGVRTMDCGMDTGSVGQAVDRGTGPGQR